MIRHLRELYQNHPEVKIFFFGGTPDNAYLVESVVKAVEYYQEQRPGEPIKAWISSVPADELERENVRRRIFDNIRSEFKDPMHPEDGALFN